MENTALTTTETYLLTEKIAKNISKLTEFQKGYLLGMIESQAAEKQEEEKKAG